jgi:pyruvate kinase
MDYQIVATLGPASQEEAVWLAMHSAGATAFRLNTSHLSLAQVTEWLRRLAIFLEAQHASMPVVLDLQGSKWRVGRFEAFELAAGQRLRLFLGQEAGSAGSLPVPHADFFRAAPGAGRVILLNDAKIKLEVENLAETELAARVVVGGLISSHKGITFLESDYRVEQISPKDQAIVAQARQYPWSRIAISYVRDGHEMRRYRRFVGPGMALIAKLERGPAMEDALEIARSADEVWICRGDLGAELGLPGMARAVARISERLNEFNIPVLMAGQVLEHMTREAAPTRSEICYLHDTLAHGYQGVVLSDEAAVGQYPVESCLAAAMFRKD